MKRFEPIDAAKRLIETVYPSCNAAILAGSVVRGEATQTSDLDIVIFDDNVNSSYRESLIKFDWQKEVFVHNFISYKNFFEVDYKRARPTIHTMLVEGIVVKNDARLKAILNEARHTLERGPEAWSEETLNVKRYFISDVFNVFIGCNKREEGIFIANALVELIREFVLRANKQWLGSSKWMYRALKKYDEAFALQFVKAFESYYKHDDKKPVIDLVEKLLKPYGGLLFEGFSVGKS